jgi:flagellar basal-body rod protein FlgB
MTGLPSHFHLVSSAIEFAKQNHSVISQNVANVNTPKYQAKQLSFDELLAHIEKGGDQPPEFQMERVKGLEVRNDGNNVDLDRELANLKKNALLHDTLTQLLGAKMSLMQRAITGQ